jgi:hypothetical protein
MRIYTCRVPLHPQALATIWICTCQSTMLVLRPISWRLAFDVEEGHDSRDLLESFLLHGAQRCITFSKLVAPEFVPKQTNISTPTVGIYRYEILINTFYLRKEKIMSRFVGRSTPQMSLIITLLCLHQGELQIPTNAYSTYTNKNAMLRRHAHFSPLNSEALLSLFTLAHGRVCPRLLLTKHGCHTTGLNDI